MKKLRKNENACGLDQILAAIGAKWALLIIRDLLSGTKRFGELEQSLSGISPRTLTVRLKELEAQGLVMKKIHPVSPPCVEYSLTSKGKSLAPILKKMQDWSQRH